MKKLIEKIVQKEFDERPGFVKEIVEKGVVNKVYVVGFGDATYVLRMQTGDYILEMYQKERWCADVVSQMGISTPAYTSVGQEGEYAYCFQEYIEGVNGADAEDKTAKIWQTLGEYARRFNTIPAPQYTKDIEKIETNIFENGLFESKGLFTEEKLVAIKERFDETKRWDFPPTLCHGNLHPNNTIIHPSGRVHLIDWGSARGYRAPHTELADIHMWNSGKENIALFCKGYGISEKELGDMMRDIQTLILIRHLTVMRWRIEQKGEETESDYITSTASHINSIDDFTQPILFTKNL